MGILAHAPVAVTDLGGNILWSYNPGARADSTTKSYQALLLPMGTSWVNFSGAVPDGTNSILQEVGPNRNSGFGR